MRDPLSALHGLGGLLNEAWGALVPGRSAGGTATAPAPGAAGGARPTRRDEPTSPCPPPAVVQQDAARQGGPVAHPGGRPPRAPRAPGRSPRRARAACSTSGRPRWGRSAVGRPPSRRPPPAAGSSPAARGGRRSFSGPGIAMPVLRRFRGDGPRRFHPPLLRLCFCPWHMPET
ncbi:hypothetical protein [Streptomyces sp.]|uniref:hypothetical protein n=1 Tax=Streptomyces sp. TaxID=1931 RepID=UPI0039C8D8FC